MDLEEKIALQEKKFENLSIKCDDNEQYSRRYCLRMHGLKFDKYESQNDLVSKTSECFSEIGLPYEEEQIDRVHRIGKPYSNISSGLTMKPIITKFKSWRYRQNVYRDRPRRFENGKKKPDESSFSVSLDLTKRRCNLLKFAQGIVKEMGNVRFFCADVNCSPAIRFKNGIIKHFNSEHEFRSLLNDNYFLLLLQFFYCLEMFILLSFWIFIALRNFIFQIVIIDVLLMATYLVTGFYVNSEVCSYKFFFIDAG